MKVKAVATVKNVDGGDSSCALWHENHALSGNDNGIIKEWNPDDMSLISETKAHDYPIYHMLSDTKSNQVLTASSDMNIYYWTYSNGKLTKKRSLEGCHKDAIRKLCLHEDYLYSADESGEVKIWNRDTGDFISNVSMQEEVWDIVIDGNLMLTARDKDVLISELRKRDDKTNISTRMTIDGRSPLFVNENNVCFVERGGMELLVRHKNQSGFPAAGKLQGHSMIVNSITGFSTRLYSAGWDKRIIEWDLNKLCSVGEVQLEHYVNALSLDLHAERLLAAGEAGLITLIDLKA